MGQCLSLKIHKDGELLANAYYYWVGYTSSAIHLTSQVLEKINDLQAKNEVLQAISLLESTGAHLTTDEILYVKKSLTSFNSSFY